ncbi:hypothetical protein WDW37_11840 [Bdellovibrionota bacterium FG-1]
MSIDDTIQGPKTEDLFDLKKLRLSGPVGGTIAVKKTLTTVPVRKPGRHDFVRVKAGEDWRLETAILEDKEQRETYLVSPDLWSELSSEVTPKVLLLTVNRSDVVAIWPISLPDATGRSNDWSRSALEAAERATKSWVRVSANMSLGGYDTYEAMNDLPEPNWPNLTFDEIIKLAFRDKFIKSLEHPVLRRLRGEI